MKVTLETYRKIQEYKKLGLSKRKTAAHFGLSARTMDKLWNVTEDEFLNAEKTRFEYLDLYKEFMLEQLHTCPQIRVTNLYFKLKENFSDFDCPRSAFYRYIQSCARTMAMTSLLGGKQNQEHHSRLALKHRWISGSAR